MNSHLKQELLNRQYQKDMQARAEKARFVLQQENIAKLGNKDNPGLVKTILNALGKFWMWLLHRQSLLKNKDVNDKSNHERAYV